MIGRRVLVAVLLTGVALPQARGAETWIDRITFGGVMENEAAFGFHEPTAQKLDFMIEPWVEVDFADGWRFTVIGRGRADPADELEPGEPDQSNRDVMSRRLLIGDAGELELREAYLDGEIEDVDLRIGKQQIVWGQADGLKVLDVVNPQSFREFILDDFDDSRIPLWSLNAQVPIGGVVAQFVWIPDQTYHDIPEPGAVYELTAREFRPEIPTGVLVERRKPKRPNRALADSDVGLRLSSFLGGWDLSLNYLYHYDDKPVLFQDRSARRVTITPGYERSHLYGASFANAIGDFTLRGEVAYLTGRFFLSDDADNADGVSAGNEVSYVVGLDWHGLDNTLVSGQFFQSILTESAKGLARDRVRNDATLLLRHTMLDERLEAEVLWLQNLDQGDGLVRPRLRYELRSDIRIWAGADIFYGASDGLFGQFDGADRFVVGLEWGF